MLTERVVFDTAVFYWSRPGCIRRVIAAAANDSIDRRADLAARD